MIRVHWRDVDGLTSASKEGMLQKDVPDRALVVGNPGQLTGWLCQSGMKKVTKGKKAECQTCRQQYRVSQDGMRAA